MTYNYEGIQSIELLEDDDELVYDLSVQDSEMFFAKDPGNLNNQFLLVHNSAMYPSIGMSFNISPNTYLLRMFIDTNILARWVYEGHLNAADAELEIKVIVKPMVWFGKDGELGVHTTAKIKEIFKIIKDNDYIVSMAGAVFNKHEQVLGFHTDLLTELRKQRKYYQALEKEAKNKGDSDNAKINGKAQLVRKVVMNGGYYGAQGTDKFNFFDIGLAESITKTAKIEISYVCHGLEEYIHASESKSTATLEARK